MGVYGSGKGWFRGVVEWMNEWTDGGGVWFLVVSVSGSERGFRAWIRGWSDVLGYVMGEPNALVDMEIRGRLWDLWW